MYIVGSFDSTAISFGEIDMVMAKFDALTGAKKFLIHMGESIYDVGVALTVLPNTKVLVAGHSNSQNLTVSNTQDLIFVQVD